MSYLFIKKSVSKRKVLRWVFWVGVLGRGFLGGFLLPTLPVAGAGVPPRGCRGSPGACSVAAVWPPSPCTPAPPKQTTSVMVRIHDILVPTDSDQRIHSSD